MHVWLFLCVTCFLCLHLQIALTVLKSAFELKAALPAGSCEKTMKGVGGRKKKRRGGKTREQEVEKEGERELEERGG